MINKVITTLLTLLEIRHTESFAKETINGTPFANSLYGVGLVLAKYNVQTDSVRYRSKSDISNDVTPCIILYDGKFAILSNIDSSEVILLISGNKRVVIPWEKFEKGWDGTALIPKATKYSKEPNYAKHRKEELKRMCSYYGLSLAMTAIIFILVTQNPYIVSWAWWGIFIINIIGVTLSVLLLQKQLNIPNRISDKICGLTKAGDCDDVTHSSGSELFGLFKLSEIGFAFFSANIICLITIPNAISILAIISYIVLPFSFWSIWYQKFKAKSWCVLCLGVLTAMWLQAALYCFSGIITKYNIPLIPLCITGLTYPLIFFDLTILMSILSNKRKSEHWQSDFVNLKAQDKVITAYFQAGNSFEITSGGTSEMVFGDAKAPSEITVFSNPYCNPCAAMHEQLKDVPGDAVRIRYVMTYFNDELSQINRYIIAAYQQLGADKTWDIMTEWYKSGKEKGVSFFQTYNLDIDSDSVIREFNKQNNWSKSTELHGTPTVIINGHELTGPYTVDDAKLISDFA